MFTFYRKARHEPKPSKMVRKHWVQHDCRHFRRRLIFSLMFQVLTGMSLFLQVKIRALCNLLISNHWHKL